MIKWNWWKKDNSMLEALKEVMNELNYYKEYTDSLKRELARKEQAIATYSDMYNKVANEVDDLKEQIKKYNELIDEDWIE